MNIPQHAEDTFRRLCSAYGATCNQSENDEHGWDFLVEFPIRREAHLPLDLSPPSKKCLVQIKSSKSRRPKIGMKLSNAFEFARTDMPCFSVLFSYRDDEQQEPIYWNHFWEREITRCLKRIRTIRDDALAHKANFVVSGPLLSQCHSDELLPSLEDSIDSLHYATDKRNLSDEAGFDDSRFSGQITWKEGVTIEDIVDAQIGLKDALEVSQFTLRSNRFKTSKPIVTANSDATVQMRSHPKECYLQFSSERTGREVIVKAQAFRPMIPGLPWEKTRIRAVSKFVQVVFSGGTQKLDFSFKTDEEPLRPSEMLEMLKLFFIFSAGDVAIIFRTDQGKEMLGGHGHISPKPLDKRYLDFERFSEALAKEETVAKFSIGDLIDHAEEIVEHNSLLAASELLLEATPDWGQTRIADPISGLYYSAVEFGGATICTVGRRLGRYENADNEGRFVFGAAEYAHWRYYDAPLDEIRKELEQELERRGQRHPAYVVLGDLRKLGTT
jgi:hypothetical protein